MQPRAYERARTLMGGRIILSDGSTTIDCVLRNVSAGGALIEISPELPLAKCFSLKIVKTGEVRTSEVRWRRGGQVGLKFTDGAEIALREDVPVSLQQENIRLKARLAYLMERIEAEGVGHILAEDQQFKQASVHSIALTRNREIKPI